jgi:hypothetical protein
MSAIEYYRHELSRIAWRMQYRAKRDFKRQQAVNKWKKKMIQELCQKMSF